MQSWLEGGILMASLPMARTDLRTKSTSISVAYLGIVSFEYVRRIECLLRQLSQDLLDVLLRRQHKDEFKLRHLDVNGVVIFAKEDSDIIS